MNIGMIFAMQEELDAFLDNFNHYKTHTHKHLNVKEVNINNHTCYCILSGIGKVNAGYATALLAHMHNVKIILNSGVAGGLNVDVGTIVLSKDVGYHDVDVTSFGYDHGQIPGFEPTFKSDTAILQTAEKIVMNKSIPYKIGTIVSGDQFVTKLSSIEAIQKTQKNIYAIEMEAAAIAHIARIEGIPFLIIRAISDVIGKDAQAEDFKLFLNKSAKQAAEILETLIRAL